ncbi:phosphatase PAP2 family protein [Psychrobacter sp. DAB_AL62B]|uniref:phosphatase PAP2 family protein n=1 Tax=Psychrobacter sp. DAB_AL62B TaxID=1028420 RepID=UPI002380DB1A|nr:phosphatase PAP2 family protein [Psychrobacter sp. DAB_AL62B]MDE4453935.1 phosphatase PAP2 family protein [Psychrobacter sp. DAB_AL62B]
MFTVIQTNQQLVILSGLVLLVIIFLWILQYCVIHYGKKLLAHVMRYWLSFDKSIGLSKRLIVLKNDYPKLYHLFWQRLHIQHFYGLPLTFLLLVMGYTLALFLGLVEDVVTSDSIVAIDYFVSHQMALLSESSVVNFFIFITSLGSTPITCLVALLTCIFCWVIRQRYIVIGLLIATLGSTVFTFLSKLLFQRARPADILLFEQTNSFPSGHATVTVALYGFIAYMAIRFSHSFIRQVRIAVIAVFFAIMIGLSRIVLNEHYLSDVLGGYLVGTLWLTLAISVTEWLSVRSKVNWQIDWLPCHIYLVWLSVVCVLIGTLIYAGVYQFPLLL